VGGIWILAENQEQTLELMNKGLELARDLNENLITFSSSRKLAEDYIDHGADQVYLLPPLPEKEVWGAYTEAIASQAADCHPSVIMLAGTMRGREMAARLAQKLNTGLCSGCINIALNQSTGQVEMERLIYGGAAVQTVVCVNTPQMVTITTRTFEPAVYQKEHKGEIKEIHLAPASPVKIQEQRPAASTEENLSEARVIVCVGRGIEKQEDLDMLNQLAQTIDGMTGCTRPISEELHWLPEESCIGLSGQQVKPDLYIGVGVSGQIQHTTGIRDSKAILAINSDENAPIFEVADFGVVGDLYDIVPKLIKELEKRKA
jgi:electron transfer flavoprotein alpha subunit